MNTESRNTNGRFIKGGKPWHSGKTGVYTQESLEKMSLAKIGKPNWRKGQTGVYKHTDEWKKQQSIRSKGHRLSDEAKKKISEANSGSKNGQWKGGVFVENHNARHTYEYRLWRKTVLERDKKCVWCKSETMLEVDHIKSFSEYPELRLEIENGRVLCHTCHKKTYNYRRKTT